MLSEIIAIILLPEQIYIFRLSDYEFVGCAIGPSSGAFLDPREIFAGNALHRTGLIFDQID